MSVGRLAAILFGSAAFLILTGLAVLYGGANAQGARELSKVVVSSQDGNIIAHDLPNGVCLYVLVRPLNAPYGIEGSFPAIAAVSGVSRCW